MTPRHSIRKTGTGLRAFDDVHWPIDVALIVLGGFLVGTALAFLRFDEPTWYRNAWFPIIAVPLFIGAGMYWTRRISRLWLRRSMQFGMLISLLFHLVLTLALMEVTLRARPWTAEPRAQDFVRQAETLIPEFRTFEIAEAGQPEPEFEQPVETDEAIPVVQVEEQAVVDQSPLEPQPQPVENPEQTARPTIARHNELYESVPRRSEQSSRMSRNLEDIRLADSQASAAQSAPAARAAAQAQPQPQPLTANRQSPAAGSPESMPSTNVAAVETPSVQRSTVSDAIPQTAQNPLTVRRDSAAARITPSLDARQTPQAATQQLQEPVLTPRETDLAHRAATGSMQRSQQDVLQDSAEPNVVPERRQNDVNENPVAAATPRPLPTREPRLTTRPTEELTSQLQDAPSVPTETPTNLQATPLADTAERTTPQSATQPLVTQAAEPALQTPALPAAQRTPDEPSMASTEPATTPSTARSERSELAQQISDQPPSATVVEQPMTTNAQGALLAADSPLSRRSAAATANVPTTDLAVPENQPAQPAPAVVEADRTSAAAADSSTPSTEAAQTLTMDRSATAAPQISIDSASIAAEITPSSSPVLNSGGLRPTDSALARQAATAATDNSRQPSETATASQTPQVARNESQRLLASSEPALNALEQPTERPSRAQNIADAPQSPANVASPANQVTAEQSPALAPPSSLALSRGSAGTAGSGYSPNLDRQAPAGESPALASSGSSRERATQATDDGPALAPVARAEVARAQADQLRPSAAMEAAGGLAGPVPAGDVQTGPAASASASPVELSARADRGTVSADRGSLQVDVGPQRIVSQFQSGRGAGGGSEMLNLAAQTRSDTAARPQRSGSTNIAINVDNAAPAAAAPAGDGGSRPLAIDASPAATTAQRSDPGGTGATSGAPSVAQLEGPASEPNASDVAGPLAVRTARESAAPAAAGSIPGLADRTAGEPATTRQSLAGIAPTAAGIDAPAASSEQPAADPQSASGAPANATPRAANVEVAGRPAGAGNPGSMASPAPAGEVAEGSPVSDAPPAASLAARRSEAVDAPAGEPIIGGGPGLLQRQAQGPTISSEIAGAAIESPGDLIASAADSPSSGPAASGIAIAQQAGGISAGAITPLSESSAAVATDTGGPLRAGGAGAGDVPILAQPSTIGGPGRSQANVSPGLEASEAEPAGPSGLLPAGAGDIGPQEAQLANEPRSSGVSVSLPVDIDAPSGQGGLALVPELDSGLPDRRARPDTNQIQSQIARLPRQNVGGRPQFNPAAVQSAEAFRKRVDRPARGKGGGQLDPETERAIELGLVFLARYQQDDGRWSLQGFDREKPAIQSDAAATALALLAFQGAGYTHVEHQYAETVRKALDFLVANQNADGMIFADADEESNRFAKLYTHAIAALALCEAYGMTQDPALREPAQRAIDYMIETQNKELGGWRYAPQVSSDTSVTGWMMMAMKSGELGGLNVPKTAYDGVLNWLEAAKASDREPHLYRYNPYAENSDTQRHGRVPSKTMTSVGLLMRLYLGWRRDNLNMQRGAQYLRDNLPSTGTANQNVLERDRDTYYWYYATQVMFHMGGDAWRDWNARLHPLLIESQIQQGAMAGSWDPLLPVPDRWAGHGGRLYVTTMNLLSMEVSYRHLPLYEDTAK